MTSSVQAVLRACNTAFRSCGQARYSVVRAGLRRGNKAAKEAYKTPVEQHLADNNPRQVWQGLKHFTNYSTSSGSSVDASWAGELDYFFARIETTPSHTVALPPTGHEPTHTPGTSGETRVQVCEYKEGCRPGWGSLPVSSRHVLTNFLGVFSKIFNLSLAQSFVPPCRSQ